MGPPMAGFVVGCYACRVDVNSIGLYPEWWVAPIILLAALAVNSVLLARKAQRDRRRASRGEYTPRPRQLIHRIERK
jgi:membrane protein implicated in regulation of membrane protease activity